MAILLRGRSLAALRRYGRTLSASSGAGAPALASLTKGLQLDPLPPPFTWERSSAVPHAPKRTPNLTAEQERLALRNALRYFPEATHAELAPEFARELQEYGHIYMYRFKPSEAEMAAWATAAGHDGADDAGAAPHDMRGYPVSAYAGTHVQSRAMQMMIMNNLDPRVAQFPDELVTYGGNGAVFSNWAQFRLTMKYLSEMTTSQTLTMYSGHPMGLFPSHPDAPRVVVSNGMMIPRHSTKENLETLYACGNSLYGQMTAGSFCYIGPQGIVHGTAITLLNAARKYLPPAESNAGRVYLTSGLGGMSGAQPKAADIVGMISITAEVDGVALRKRHAQGWVRFCTVIFYANHAHHLTRSP
jgi:urocanate hydratase